MTTLSNWMKIAQAYKTWLFTNTLTGVDLLPDALTPDVDQMRIRIAKTVRQKKAWDGYKSLHLTPAVPEKFGIGGNTEEYIGYGIQTVLAWPSNSDDSDTDIDDWMNWREVVRNKLLPTTATPLSLSDPPLNQIDWAPQAVFDATAFSAQYLCQGFTAWFWVYERRQTRSI